MPPKTVNRLAPPDIDEKVDELARLVRNNIDNKSGFAEDHVKSRLLQKIFQQFDIDHTGSMSYAEFHKVMEHLNIQGQEEEVSALFDRYDLAENGSLSFKEFSDGLFGLTPAPLADPKGRETLKKFRERLLQRAGEAGVQGLTRSLRIMDTSKDNALTKEELFNGMQRYGIQCTLQEVEAIIKAFDVSGDGLISIEEFLRGIRGRMPRRRRLIVRDAYSILDRNGDESVTLEELSQAYRTDQHPLVLKGQKTQQEVLKEFAASWDKSGDGVITWSEFLDYYKSISAGIDSDDYFELMMRNVWHMSGGEGVCENTSCRRVLVTYKDGRQTIEEIKNDLGIGPKDLDKMRANLEKQGIQNIARIEIYS